MGWQVKFIPDEVSSMSINCNGEHALNWNSNEGNVTKDVPAQWRDLQHVHFFAAGSPNGRNAHCKILWNGQERRNMEFDNGEDWES